MKAAFWLLSEQVYWMLYHNLLEYGVECLTHTAHIQQLCKHFSNFAENIFVYSIRSHTHTYKLYGRT